MDSELKKLQTLQNPPQPAANLNPAQLTKSSTDPEEIIGDEQKNVQLLYQSLQDAYTQLRHELNSAERKIQKYEEDIEQPVPRLLYTQLQQQHFELDKEHVKMRNEFRMLNYDLQRLMDVTDKIVKERDDYYDFAAGARGSCTPRPDWDKCANIIDGGFKRWAEISANKSSNELVDVLLNEIVGGNDPLNNIEYITCLGTSAKIPRFLRYYGEVKYRRLRIFDFGNANDLQKTLSLVLRLKWTRRIDAISNEATFKKQNNIFRFFSFYQIFKKLFKRDVCIYIKDIWDVKLTSNENMPMSDYLLEYFKKRFNHEHIVFEWCYNIYEACKRYLHDFQIEQFYLILNGDLDEDVYKLQLNEISRMVRAIFLKKRSADKKKSSTKDTPFTKSMLLEVLHKTFPSKNQKSLALLLRAAIDESTSTYSEIIDYNKILYCDMEGHYSQFLLTLVNQITEERLNYSSQIIKELQNNNTNDASAVDIYHAICKVDPDIPTNEIERYLKWIFKKDISTVDQLATINISTLRNLLNNGAIWNHSVQRVVPDSRASVTDIMSGAAT